MDRKSNEKSIFPYAKSASQDNTQKTETEHLTIHTGANENPWKEKNYLSVTVVSATACKHMSLYEWEWQRLGLVLPHQEYPWP